MALTPHPTMQEGSERLHALKDQALAAKDLEIARLNAKLEAMTLAFQHGAAMRHAAEAAAATQPLELLPLLPQQAQVAPAAVPMAADDPQTSQPQLNVWASAAQQATQGPHITQPTVAVQLVGNIGHPAAQGGVGPSLPAPGTGPSSSFCADPGAPTSTAGVHAGEAGSGAAAFMPSLERILPCLPHDQHQQLQQRQQQQQQQQLLPEVSGQGSNSHVPAQSQQHYYQHQLHHSQQHAQLHLLPPDAAVQQHATTGSTPEAGDPFAADPGSLDGSWVMVGPGIGGSSGDGTGQVFDDMFNGESPLAALLGSGPDPGGFPDFGDGLDDW